MTLASTHKRSRLISDSSVEAVGVTRASSYSGAYPGLERVERVAECRQEPSPSSPVTSGLYRLNQWRSLARGARLARRDEGAYRPYSTEEQRRQAGCPAPANGTDSVDTGH